MSYADEISGACQVCIQVWSFLEFFVIFHLWQSIKKDNTLFNSTRICQMASLKNLMIQRRNVACYPVKIKFPLKNLEKCIITIFQISLPHLITFEDFPENAVFSNKEEVIFYTSMIILTPILILLDHLFCIVPSIHV